MRAILPIHDHAASAIDVICIQYQIKSWIENNSYLTNQGLIWHIGITDIDNLKKLETNVRLDLNCKHWKYWNLNAFKDAMHLISDMNKLPNVFKSPHNSYLNKGTFIFIYKTIVPKNCQLFYTLHKI